MGLLTHIKSLMYFTPPMCWSYQWLHLHNRWDDSGGSGQEREVVGEEIGISQAVI